MSNWLSLCPGGLKGNAGVPIPVPTPTPSPTPTPTPTGIPNVAPGLGWAGVATTSGAPVDADGGVPRTVTTYAKPGARILTEPGFLVVDSNDLVIGIHAYAGNASGPLPVVCELWIEGATFTVPFGTWTYTDANGNLRTIYGYFARLKHASFLMDGAFNVKWNLTCPSDPTFQNRTLGPFTYTRVSGFTGYDYDVQVGVGRTYTTLPAAMNALQAAGAQNPRITIMDSGDYQIGGSTTTYVGAGYLTITHAPGVVARIYRTGDENTNVIRYMGIRLRGSGIKIDLAMHPSPNASGNALNVLTQANAGASARKLILDGCEVYCSTGRDSKEVAVVGGLMGASRGIGLIVLDDTYFHDLLTPIAVNTANGLDNVDLIRNARMSRIGGTDVLDGKMYNVYGLTLDDQSLAWWQDDATNVAGTIQYSSAVGGAATSAAWATDKANGDKTGNLLLKKDGATVATIPLVNGANGWRTQADLKALIEANAGWTYTVTLDNKYAHFIAANKAQSAGNIPVPDQDCLDKAATVRTVAGFHGDLAQPVKSDTGPVECIIYVNCKFSNVDDAQEFFVSGSINGFDDCFFINWAVGGDSFNLYGTVLKAASNGALRHVNWWHCGFYDQWYSFNHVSADDRSSFRGGVLRTYTHTSTFGSSQFKFDNNFIENRNTAVPNETNQRNVGGTIAGLFTDQKNGDFSQKIGATLELVPSLVPFDVDGNPRGALSRVGALA